MMTLHLAATLAFAVLSTSFISGIFGMAGGMILMGVLLAIMPLAPAMVLHGLTQLTANVWRACLWHRHARWALVGTYAAGTLLAGTCFLAANVIPNKAVTYVALGLISYVGLSVPQRLAPNITRRSHGFACGILCTVLQLTAGVSGPIFDVFFVRSGLQRKQVVATKAAIQALGHLLKVVYFAQFLALGGADVAPAAIALAVLLAIAGTQLSRHVLELISDAQFTNWTRRLIAGVAGIYLLQSTFLLLTAPGNTA